MIDVNVKRYKPELDTLKNQTIITIEDTLEWHLDRIFPHRDIVAVKTNNIASYSVYE